jgi:hypothetical protein
MATYKNIPDLTSQATTVNDTDLSEIYQGSVNKKIPASVQKTYFQSGLQPVLEFDDSLTDIDGVVTLVNDSGTPGNSKYYGTDGGGVLGYHAISATSSIQTQVAFVDQTVGNDTTGTIGNLDLPFATYYNGVSPKITSYSSNVMYAVRYSAGSHAETSPDLKPNVNLFGDSWESTSIYFSSGGMYANAALSTVLWNPTAIVKGFNFYGAALTNININLAGMSLANNSQIDIYFQDCNMLVPCYFSSRVNSGNPANDTYHTFNCNYSSTAALTINGGLAELFHCKASVVGVYSTTSPNCSSTATIDSSSITTLNIGSNLSSIAVTVTITNSNVGTITIAGNNTILNIDTLSYDRTSISVTSGTPTINIIDKVLPNGATATTQSAGDNSTKVATTAYLDAKLGANNGIATLNSVGVLPDAQVPAFVLGDKSYQGTWDASGGVYPSSPSNGQYWTISVAGTMGGIAYAVNDEAIYYDSVWSKVSGTATVAQMNLWGSTWTGSSSITTVGTLSGYVPTTRTVNGHALSGNISVTTIDLSLNNLTNDAQTKAAIVPNTAPNAGQILVGNAGGTAYAPQTIGTDITIASTGAATIANNAVTVGKMAQAGANTYIGNATGSTANVSAVSTNTAFNLNFETTAANIMMNGVQSVGSGTTIPHANHVHPTDTSRQAALTNPVTGDGSGAAGYLAAYTGANTISQNISSESVGFVDTTRLNVFLGPLAGAQANGYIRSSYIGFGAGYGYTSAGNFNTGMGCYCMYGTGVSSGTDNAGHGYKALNGLSSGSYNTGIGSASGQSINTGSYNTALGYEVLSSITTQSGCVGIGAYAGAASTTENTFYVNNVAQGNATNDKNYSLMYGTFSGTAGSLTGQQLTVNGNLTVTGNTYVNNVVNGYTASSSTGGTITLTVASPQTLRLTGSGNEIVQLPDATTLTLGHTFTFINDSTNVFTINDGSGSTINAIQQGGRITVQCVSNGLTAGSWLNPHVDDLGWISVSLTLGGSVISSSTLTTIYFLEVGNITYCRVPAFTITGTGGASSTIISTTAAIPTYLRTTTTAANQLVGWSNSGNTVRGWAKYNLQNNGYFYLSADQTPSPPLWSAFTDTYYFPAQTFPYYIKQ